MLRFFDFQTIAGSIPAPATNLVSRESLRLIPRLSAVGAVLIGVAVPPAPAIRGEGYFFDKEVAR
jgi:hypothetical protein